MSSIPIATRLAVDIGGTFTDVVSKPRPPVLHQGPDDKDRARGRRADRHASSARQVAASDIDLIVHGTTLATNAIIERKGAVTALVTTRGFRDFIEMAQENRFEQYDIFIEKAATPWCRATCASPCRSGSTPPAAFACPWTKPRVEALAETLKSKGVSKASPSASCTATPTRRTNGAPPNPVCPTAGRPHLGLVRGLPGMREYERFSTTSPTPMSSR